MNEAYIKKHDFETWRCVKDKFGDMYSFMEELYLFQNGLNEPPKCSCGNPVKFRNINLGYQKFCSKKCSNSNPDKIKTTKDTCIRKFGGVAPACSEEVTNKMIKTARKNGYDFRSHTTSLSDETKKKMKKTCIERYGVDNVMKLDEYKQKVSSSIDYESVTKKAKHTRKQKELLKHQDIIDINYETHSYIVKCPHPECTLCQEKQFTIPIPRYRDRIRDHTELCTILLPVCDSSIKDTYPEIFVRNILDEYGVEYITNDRTVLGGKELDIYIPLHSIAVECNGIYWHADNSSTPSDKQRHYNKWKQCCEKDIQLLTIWEDQIYNIPNVVKNIILAKLGIYEKRIGARECRVTIDDNTRDFLNNNHIQGSCRYDICYSLRYMGEIVGVMCFSKTSTRVGIGNPNNESWELVRFCTKSGWQITGGALRLLTHFREDHPGIDIISFSSHDISNGGLYDKLGFKRCGEIKSSYWYIDQKSFQRYHRFSFTKASLVKKGYDPKMTEFQIMDSLPYWRIYDSGQTKHILYAL